MEQLSKFIVFQMKEQSFGVDIKQVRSIEKMQHVTEVPKTSDFIKGVVSLRGEVTPVIDLKERLQLGQTVLAESTRVLIVHANNVQVGLIVDSATDVIDIDQDAIEPAPQLIGGVDSAFLKGVAKLVNELLILLDLEHILNLEEIHEVDRAMKA